MSRITRTLLLLFTSGALSQQNFRCRGFSKGQNVRQAASRRVLSGSPGPADTNGSQGAQKASKLMKVRGLKALGAVMFLVVAACAPDPEEPPNDGSGANSGGRANGAGGEMGSGAVAGTGAAGTGAQISTGGTDSAGGGASAGGSGGAPVSGGTGGIGGFQEPSPRSRVLFNDAWKFHSDDPLGVDSLNYEQNKQWVLPTGNPFVEDSTQHAVRPQGNLGEDVSYVSTQFDDSAWESVDLPHDYAIEGPYTDSVSSSMGRLPSPGVSWYRKSFSLSAEDADKSIFLDLDGAMQYSMVWVNGQFVGGWPYGYASYRLDLTSYLSVEEENVVAIRLHTPVPQDNAWDSGSSRWYPGAGIYRNVWLTKTDPVHVGHWGTFVTTPEITETSATVDLEVTVDNDSDQEKTVELSTEIFELNDEGIPVGAAVAALEPVQLTVPSQSSVDAQTTGAIDAPKLWGVPPTQTPNMYVGVTYIREGENLLDRYETRFGVRSIEFDGEGFILNGERLKLEGVCLHHDLGALGAAVNLRARERQLEIMREMGSNAIRTAHNPFEPEFYDLADRMGFLVMDEAFDVWSEGKADNDHHVFFDEWHEQDLRALIRRDRNHPSVIMWSIGNEVLEQHDPEAGPALGEKLTTICHEEDPTRPTVAGMNQAEPDNPFSESVDAIGLNYQGTGVRDLGAQYPTYHEAYPDKFIVGTETTSTFSTRGTYLFPVTSQRGVPANGSSGVDAQNGLISSYDLYHADWSYSPDEEFESQDKWSYVGGEFVWTGFDYLGEPTPLDSVARSSYFGIVDLAGFKKDRFYLYQAKWRPDLPMAHILPHWTWPERIGETTPVHVYTSGDEAELFINGESLGRKEKGQYEYRLRWDDVAYEPGELSVVAYKDGEEWASDRVETAGSATALHLETDRSAVVADGADLAFLTLTVRDDQGRLVPRADDTVEFSVSCPGEIVATDNGDPTDRRVFSSTSRDAYFGKVLVIVRALPMQSGMITVRATAAGLSEATVSVTTQSGR